MTIQSEEIDTMVVHTIIREAAARHGAATARMTKVAAELAQAKAAHAVAKAASDLAIAGDGPTSALEAEADLEAAARVVRVATRVHEAAVTAHLEAGANILVARGEAHKPVYLAGIACSLEAAKKADAARLMLAEAEQDYANARSLLNHAPQNGTQHVVYDQGHNKPMSTYQDEIARWSVPNGWWAGKPV